LGANRARNKVNVLKEVKFDGAEALYGGTARRRP